MYYMHYSAPCLFSLWDFFHINALRELIFLSVVNWVTIPYLFNHSPLMTWSCFYSFSIKKTQCVCMCVFVHMCVIESHMSLVLSFIPWNYISS